MLLTRRSMTDPPSLLLQPARPMKKIEAVIKPFKLDEVKEALQDLGVQGMTVLEAKGYGRQKGPYRALSRRRIRGRLPAQDQNRGGGAGRPTAAAAIEAITTAARTGRIGDGKIFVSELIDVVRIRTGESGRRRFEATRSEALARLAKPCF